MTLRRFVRARLVVLGALISVSVVPAQIARTARDAPASCIEPNRSFTLYAEELTRAADGSPRLGWGLTPNSASIPGPLIEMVEGDCVAITVVNDVPRETLRELRDDPILGSRDPDMPLGVSLHVHGVKYTQASDGTFETNSWVRSGEARTYVWYAAPKVVVGGRILSQGTAGYWWYHDHVIGTAHGTGGAASGLFGGLVVRRPEDIRPQRSYVVGMGPNATLNLQKHPDCQDKQPTLEDASSTCLVAVQGERVEFVVVGFGDDFHTFHLHGHNWADNRTGMLTSQVDDTRVIDNRTVGPADTFGFQIVAGEEVGPGNWMLHCHVQSHSDRGMTTFLHVLTSDGTPLPAVPVPFSSHGHH